MSFLLRYPEKVASRKFSRRSFGKGVGLGSVASAALSTALPGSSLVAAQQSAETGHPQADFYKFPDKFLWGCATAAYQVEGAAEADGRGPSIWDTFSHTRGKVANNDTGDVSADDYHRYKEDVQILKSLGCKVYRFSTAWPRIFPSGTGQPNERGIDFYNRLVDELLANGIEPYCTLFHWDLPQTLQDRYKGWQSRETSAAFGEYAGYVASKLSDRVRHFFTMNEFSSFVDLGHKQGIHAPGLKLPPAQLNQVRHNAVLAHGLAVQAIRAKGKPGTKVGLAENLLSGIPAIEAEPHLKAAAQATRFLNAQYLTVIMEGRYMDEYLQEQGAAAPKFTQEDLKIIGSPLDFIGINIYTPVYVQADGTKAGFSVLKKPQSYPHMASPWLDIGPEALYWGPRNVASIWGVKELYITENGCSSADVLTPDGQVNDTDRVMYLRNYISKLHRATVEGYPVRGYFLWSLMDNFEWADGYGLRFGIYYVDYKTLKRYPKLSAHWYREVIRRNAVV